MDSKITLPDLLDLRIMQKTVPAGARILVAVSGGADSVALLHGFHAVQQEYQYQLSVVHVNHGLRPGADVEEGFVQELCDQLRVRLYVRRLKPMPKPPQTSPEQFWRQRRYEQFAEVLQEAEGEYLALGHTADDLAETFLFHLARGTGVKGLTFNFYSETAGLPVIRPLWHTKRAVIELVLRDVGQEWVSDPSNRDLQFSRNLIRHTVIPALETINPGAKDAISNLSGYLKTLMERTGSSSISVRPYRDGTFPLTTYSDSNILADELRNFVRGKSAAIMDRLQTAQALNIINRRGSGTVALAGNITLVVTQQFAWLYHGFQPSDLQLAIQHVRDFGGVFANLNDLAVHKKLTGPVRVPALDETYWNIDCKLAESTQLHVRNRIAGDRVGSKLLAKLFIEYKLPWYLRDFAVLFVDQGQRIIAVAGMDELNGWIGRHLKINNETVCTKSDGQA